MRPGRSQPRVCLPVQCTASVTRVSPVPGELDTLCGWWTPCAPACLVPLQRGVLTAVWHMHVLLEGRPCRLFLSGPAGTRVQVSKCSAAPQDPLGQGLPATFCFCSDFAGMGLPGCASDQDCVLWAPGGS